MPLLLVGVQVSGGAFVVVRAAFFMSCEKVLSNLNIHISPPFLGVV